MKIILEKLKKIHRWIGWVCLGFWGISFLLLAVSVYFEIDCFIPVMQFTFGVSVAFTVLYGPFLRLFRFTRGMSLFDDVVNDE